MTMPTATQMTTPTAPDLHALAETAVLAARVAAGIQTRAFDSELKGEVVHPHDLKTVVDRDCEQGIVDVIRKRYPKHRILAEEGGDLGGSDEYLWIIDPLDGTVNYFHGLPQFCTCIACCRVEPGQPLPTTGSALLASTLVGVVYTPVLDELYVGIAGEGVRRNGRSFVCNSDKPMAEMIVALSFGKTDAGIDRMTRLCRVLARKAQKLRSFGCAGYDLVQVAGSRFGGLLYQGIHIWDVAAAGLILKEAGGYLQANAQPNGTWNLLAATPGVARELNRIVSGA